MAGTNGRDVKWLYGRKLIVCRKTSAKSQLPTTEITTMNDTVGQRPTPTSLSDKMSNA